MSDPIIYIKDLQSLDDIIDKIIPSTLFCDDDKLTCIENSIEYLYNYCESNPKIFCNYDYHNILDDVLDDYLDTIFENIDCDNNEISVKLDDLKCDIFKQFYTIIPKRSKKDNKITNVIDEEYTKYIQSKLEIIAEKDKLQPEQRTQEWFNQRHNLLSASTIWKSIDKQNYKNALIFEKCEPIDPDRYKRVSINTPLHWGQKYEPISQQYYEHKYDAVIEEYGCIPHSTHKFLGASPDGINVKETSSRYGRMLEIKNIVNREITGIPKKEYWVQTQLQMECCDLEECDFLECRFKEYENEEEFNNDGDFQYTKDNKYKGIMIQYYYNDKPFYEYAPFNCSKEEYEKWEEETMNKNNDKTWIKNIYWRLEEVSCVLIQRNRLWFNNVVDEMSELWDTIIEERVTGYEHRKPARRTKKDPGTTSKINSNSILNVLSNQNKKYSKSDKPKKDEKIIVINI